MAMVENVSFGRVRVVVGSLYFLVVLLIRRFSFSFLLFLLEGACVERLYASGKDY
jgi:hypothetical protein